MLIEASQQNAPAGDKISTMVNYLVENLLPKRIILFGSRAKGTARMGSDIDLALEGAAISDFCKERKLREALDQLAGIYSVDLVFLEQVDDVFSEMINQTGKVLYEKD